jgi:hypothetical protein
MERELTACARATATGKSRSKTLTASPPILSDFDLYLLGEGTHMHLYEKLGAHPMVVDGVEGVAFAVFAPAAKRVSVVGDFNFWDGRRHAMRVRGNGFWEIFVHVFNPATRQYPRSRPRACASPGSALPGLASFSPETGVKQLEFLKEIAPTVTRVVAFWNSLNPAHVISMPNIERGSKSLGVGLTFVEIQSSENLSSAFETVARSGPGGLIVLVDQGRSGIALS